MFLDYDYEYERWFVFCDNFVIRFSFKLFSLPLVGAKSMQIAVRGSQIMHSILRDILWAFFYLVAEIKGKLFYEST